MQNSTAKRNQKINKNQELEPDFLTVNCKHVAGLRSMAWRVPLPSALDEVQSRQTRPPLVANKLPWLLPHKGRMPGRSRESQSITIPISERWTETCPTEASPSWKPLSRKGARSPSAWLVIVWAPDPRSQNVTLFPAHHSGKADPDLRRFCYLCHESSSREVLIFRRHHTRVKKYIGKSKRSKKPNTLTKASTYNYILRLGTTTSASRENQ